MMTKSQEKMITRKSPSSDRLFANPLRELSGIRGIAAVPVSLLGKPDAASETERVLGECSMSKCSMSRVNPEWADGTRVAHNRLPPDTAFEGMDAVFVRLCVFWSL
ncbi:hypothetical protein CEB3_c43080 [Peptococcaceae bacterium CEB3]|nr:hypothetical protein CEB3_c43080 [Peptococcaceae bacterium CEB3]